MLFVNYKDAAEPVIHQASATVGPDGDLAESLISHLLIVLVEHVIEVLLNLIQIEEDAEVATLHLEDDLVDQFIGRVLILVIREITSKEDLVGALIRLTEVLNELQRTLLVICNNH